MGDRRGNDRRQGDRRVLNRRDVSDTKGYLKISLKTFIISIIIALIVIFAITTVIIKLILNNSNDYDIDTDPDTYISGDEDYGFDDSESIDSNAIENSGSSSDVVE